MVILHSFMTLILLILAAITGTLGPKLKRFGSGVPYAGGICLSLGIVIAYLQGARTKEVLIAVLLVAMTGRLGAKLWKKEEADEL